jgi:hypothetical protein
VRLLAQLEAAAESESERRVVARVLDPIRRYHDRKEEEAELHYEIARHQPSGWRCATVRDLWEPVLAERLAEEVRAELEPQLTGATPEVRRKMLAAAESDAKAGARERIRGLWADLDGEANDKVATAKGRLSKLNWLEGLIPHRVSLPAATAVASRRGVDADGRPARRARPKPTPSPTSRRWADGRTGGRAHRLDPLQG